MTKDRQPVEKMILHALSGRGAHVAVEDAFTGLDWKLAGVKPEGEPHSVFQLLNHLIYWNQWVVKWLAGKEPALPKHAQNSWPGNTAPQSAEEWRLAVRRLEQGLQEMSRATQHTDLLAKQRTKTPLEMLQTIALHNSYHVGQVVLLRRRLGACRLLRAGSLGRGIERPISSLPTRAGMLRPF